MSLINKLKSLFSKPNVKPLTPEAPQTPSLISNPPAYELALAKQKAQFKRDKEGMISQIDSGIKSAISYGSFSYRVCDISLNKEGKISSAPHVKIPYSAYVSSLNPSYKALKAATKVFVKRGFRLRIKALESLNQFNGMYDKTALVTLNWDKGSK